MENANANPQAPLRNCIVSTIRSDYVANRQQTPISLIDGSWRIRYAMRKNWIIIQPGGPESEVPPHCLSAYCNRFSQQGKVTSATRRDDGKIDTQLYY